jgi:hypothetical protein
MTYSPTLTRNISVPNSREEVVRIFGNPKNHIRVDGSIGPPWERQILARCTLPSELVLGWAPQVILQIRVHRKIRYLFEEVFHRIHREGNWKLIKSFDGCYNWRAVRGNPAAASLHCWGIAIDLNASTNLMGTVGDMPQEIIVPFEEAGFVHGRNFTRLDPMHFQYAINC